MPQSLTKLYLHIVFSTKNRIPCLEEDISKELYSYFGGILNNIECLPIKISGYNDHVHILCRMSKKITVIKLLEEIKKSSSKWIKTKGDGFVKFHWQDGYGAFTVSPNQVDNISKYIERQYEHHMNRMFVDEYVELLNENDIEYDERYFLD
jgi:REP element-mobilizing transposase RayT